MKTTELIEYFKSPDFKDADIGFRFLIEDIGQSLTEAEMEAGQRAIQYFAYKISVVLFPVILGLKGDPTSLSVSREEK
jgi:hypothetical protein